MRGPHMTLQGTTYQPYGFSSAALRSYGGGDHMPLLTELADRSDYERVAVDRALAVQVDMALLGLPVPSRVLDVGCSVGTVAVLLAASGHRATGIDSDIVARVQDWQDPDRLRAARVGPHLPDGCRLLQRDLREHLDVEDEPIDVVLLFSVLHHWLAGYGYTGEATFSRDDVRETLTRVCERTTTCLYVETPIEDEREEMPPDPDGEFLFPSWFLSAGLAIQVELVTSTIATNGKPRRLYRVDL